VIAGRKLVMVVNAEASLPFAVGSLTGETPEVFNSSSAACNAVNKVRSLG